MDDGQGRGRRAELRLAGREARAVLTPEVRRLASGVVAQRIAALPELTDARRVLLTRAVGEELDLLALEELLRGRGVTVALPRVAGPRLQVVDHGADDELRPGWHDVPEPVGPATDATVDAVVVPALVLDRDGGRLGYGGGHFDRLLADRCADAVAVGAVFHDQLVDAVPTEAHDVPMDVVVTERGVWRPVR